MNLIEFIGFIIVFTAMVILYFKRLIEARKRAKHPEHYEAEEHEEEKELIDLLRRVNLPQPPPKAEPQQEEMVAAHTVDEFESQMIDERSKMTGLQRKLFHSPGEKSAYALKRETMKEHLAALLSKDLQEAVVLKEILDKPKGF